MTNVQYCARHVHGQKAKLLLLCTCLLPVEIETYWQLQFPAPNNGLIFHYTTMHSDISNLLWVDQRTRINNFLWEILQISNTVWWQVQWLCNTAAIELQLYCTIWYHQNNLTWNIYQKPNTYTTACEKTDRALLTCCSGSLKKVKQMPKAWIISSLAHLWPISEEHHLFRSLLESQLTLS